MNNANNQNRAQGSERYIFADHILDSQSWQEAENKIQERLNKRKDRGDDNVLYYGLTSNTLWDEYKFLFLCQFIEYRIAELLSKLEGEEKVKPEFISTLKEHKRADYKRAKESRRIMSPASLVSDLGFTLGQLVKIVKDQTFDFDGKIDLLSKLEDFNKYRVSFMHHSFSTKKKVGETSLSSVILYGTMSGKDLLSFL